MRELILVIEDEEKILNFLRRGLIYEGYQVETAIDGTVGLASARDNPPDLVILDWMLPGMDGLEVCRRLRAASNVPILMLTAKDAVSDRVQGLDAGADDYLVKPFALDEVLARLRALLRRAKPEAPEILTFADLRLDTGTHQAFRGERPIELTAKEYELLELFLQHPRQVLTREVIYDRVWGYDFGGESNIIEVYVRYLRQKTEAEERAAPAAHRARRGLRAAGDGVTLRARLTLWYAAVLALVLLAFGLAVYALLSLSLIRQIDATLNVAADEIRLAFRREVEGIRLPPMALDLTANVYVQIWDTGGDAGGAERHGDRDPVRSDPPGAGPGGLFRGDLRGHPPARADLSAGGPAGGDGRGYDAAGQPADDGR